MKLLWPNGSTTIPRVTGEFGPRPSIDTNGDGRPDTNPFHYGMDFIGFPIVKSPVDGVVTLATRNGGAGLEVRIKADDGVVFRLFHNAKFFVSVGQRVTAGQDVAVMGTTGQSTGVHCHLQIEVNGAPVNPRTYYAQHLSAPAGSITSTKKGPRNMYLFRTLDGTIWLYTPNGRTPIMAPSHVQLFQRMFNSYPNHDTFNQLEADIVFNYIVAASQVDDQERDRVLNAVKAISVSPAPIVAAVTAALANAKVTVDSAAIAAAVEQGLADNFAALPAQVIAAESKALGNG